jgi:SAM-dependent methyltransferase
MRHRTWFWIVAAVGLSASAVGGTPGPIVAQETAAEPTRTPDVIFVPTPPKVVSAMLRVAKVTKRDTVYDLGSGDGRIVIAAARRFGARGIGIDIDPERIREARANAKKAGVTDRVKFLQQDLFETDISPASVVTLYLLNSLNLRLRPTLLKELRPGSRVVSQTFTMDDWEPDSSFEVEGTHVYFWVIPADVAGTWEWSLPRDAGGRRYTARFTQKFQKVDGTVSVESDSVSLSNARLQGDLLRFAVTDSLEGRRVRMRYSGRVSGDSITGHVVVEDGKTGRRKWTARRSGED